MTTWKELAGYKGYFETQPISIDLNGQSALSSVSWVDLIPTDTTLNLYSSCSFDTGNTWSEWEQIYQNSSIPQISVESDLTYLKIKFKAVFQTETMGISPQLNSISLTFIPVILYNNLGDLNIKPEIEFVKVGNGDFKLTNISNTNEEFKFTGLIDNETIYVHNQKEIIKTSLNATKRYSNFNDNYLDIPVGINIFKVSGNAKVKFRSQFILL